LPKKWGGLTTPFLAKGWPATPYRPLGATLKGQKKKKKGKMGLGFWGWPDHPQGPRGGFGHHLPVVGGGPATPKIPNPFFLFFFFVLGGLSGWPDHPQRSGVASATPIRPVWGGRSDPLAKNGVVRPPHFLGKEPPRFPFFFFFFNFLLFFKIKIKPTMPKTTPFWAKRRCFGRVQNGVILERRVVWTTYHQRGPK
jgi:hypothetical protein